MSRNLLAPFRRDRKRDFASGTGAELLQAKVRQVLLTLGTTPVTSGELPWRTNFGAGLERLRHQRNDDVLRELATVYVREALARWLPSVRLSGVQATRDGNQLRLRVAVQEGSQAASADLAFE